jgi:hypothetical protein
MGINYGGWYKEHDMQHHNLLGRSEHMLESDASSTIFITTKAWDEAPQWRRAIWRLLRNPFVFFTILPTVVFLCGVQNPGKVPGYRPLYSLRPPIHSLLFHPSLPAFSVIFLHSSERACWSTWSYSCAMSPACVWQIASCVVRIRLSTVCTRHYVDMYLCECMCFVPMYLCMCVRPSWHQVVSGIEM